jgi:hypothetical protein
LEVSGMGALLFVLFILFLGLVGGIIAYFVSGRSFSKAVNGFAFIVGCCVLAAAVTLLGRI